MVTNKEKKKIHLSTKQDTVFYNLVVVVQLKSNLLHNSWPQMLETNHSKPEIHLAKFKNRF